MTTDDRISSREKGRRNAARLATWFDEVALTDIPLNQYGAVSRSAVCKSLGISLSTVGSNREIQQMFAELDAKVGGATPSEPFHDQLKLRALRQKISSLEIRLTALQAENEDLRRRIYASDLLESTGRTVRP